MDIDWSVDRQYELKLDWNFLGFLAAGSGVSVLGSVRLSSSGSGLFWEDLLATHFSLWAQSRGALALTTVLQSMHLTLVLLSCSITEKKFQMGSFCFMMNSRFGNGANSSVLEVIMTRNFLNARVYLV